MVTQPCDCEMIQVMPPPFPCMASAYRAMLLWSIYRQYVDLGQELE
ncbi:predicted protein [Sclerotinia sclerotiorum 1980 UF-70]|uniref:Uncharacterized protein n=1 Tax=Sclerotinia sclerotiorum (strain ATCC 18683 / 1980 / Ss-1) TaxID=665079 RepID=A7EYQ7_SCLS1|nr:predicted protein [Sclerotinia sclerotiorum 1980 UF-70]EDN94599.1 predicted protein [Sclerotinia sclerotiorum 1980 UF-70]